MPDWIKKWVLEAGNQREAVALEEAEDRGAGLEEDDRIWYLGIRYLLLNGWNKASLLTRKEEEEHKA